MGGRMTGGTITPVDSDDASVDAGAIPPIHPIPTYRDVQIDGDIVLAPFGVSLELGATAVADTVDYSAALVANLLECGALVRIGDVMATAGHAPAGDGRCRSRIEGRSNCRPDRPWRRTQRRRRPRAVASRQRHRSRRGVGRCGRGDGVAAGHRSLSWLEQYDLPARLVDTHGRVRTTTAWSDPKAA
ncbi:hypothetical protein NJ76_30965 [Rhodococcus sp. IITR03]|nr:hypothetical protein NJ76_30965 [Rhodococcus sp. IITR03]